MRSLISDSFACWPFLTVLSQVFWQECFIEKPESVWLPLVPHLSLLELCQLAYLQYWVLCLTHPRLAPSQPAFLCVFHRFMGWDVGIFYSTKVCFHLFLFMSGLHWWEDKNDHGLSGCVLGGSQHDSHCLVLHSVQLQQICLCHSCEA